MLFVNSFTIRIIVKAVFYRGGIIILELILAWRD